jgi:hypothetical protein
MDWDGGTLDDLITMMSGPALAVRVEVMAAGSDIPAGEVHLLAGGVSDAIAPGVSPNDALEHLRAISPARYRVEPRLPNPADGDLTYPGPESGTLDSRPLAHLMRYCEQYVITCSIEVWRGNENARVDYRKGEINGVTVGGIDAPERLAEVMRWASGNYRLVVPPLKLPDIAPKGAAAARPAPAKVEAPAPAPEPAPARMTPAPAAANRTIFGMPAADVASLRAAVDAVDAGRRSAATVAAAAPAAPVAPAPTPAAAPLPPTAAMPAASPGAGTRTIFGVPAPVMAGSGKAAAPAAAPPRSKKQAKADAAAAAAQAKQERKTGARKTLLPPPEIVPPPNALDIAAAAASDPGPAGGAGAVTHAGFSATGAVVAPAPVAAAAQPAAAAPAPEVVHRRAPVVEDDTSRMAARVPGRRETPLWMYVGVGFSFGLLLLGIYRLVGMLAH